MGNARPVLVDGTLHLQSREPLDQNGCQVNWRTNAPRLAAGSLIGAVLAVAVPACSDPGDLTINNNGPGDVTVVTGDHEVTVDAEGGAVILDYGCTPADVTVEFSSGRQVVLPGPVCPDQRIVVGDATATLQPVSSSQT